MLQISNQLSRRGETFILPLSQLYGIDCHNFNNIIKSRRVRCISLARFIA